MNVQQTLILSMNFSNFFHNQINRSIQNSVPIASVRLNLLVVIASITIFSLKSVYSGWDLLKSLQSY